MGSLTYAQATFAHPLLYLGDKLPRPPLAHSRKSKQMLGVNQNSKLGAGS